MPSPEHQAHGIGSYINRVNQEYQNEYNTTDVIFDRGDNDVTVNVENTTVSTKYESLVHTVERGSLVEDFPVVSMAKLENGLWLTIQNEATGDYYLKFISTRGDTPTLVETHAVASTATDINVATKGNWALTGDSAATLKSWDCKNPALLSNASDTNSNSNLDAIDEIHYIPSSDLFVTCGHDASSPDDLRMELIALDDGNITIVGSFYSNYHSWNSRSAGTPSVGANSAYAAMVDRNSIDSGIKFAIDVSDPSNPVEISNDLVYEDRRGPKFLTPSGTDFYFFQMGTANLYRETAENFDGGAKYGMGLNGSSTNSADVFMQGGYVYVLYDEPDPDQSIRHFIAATDDGSSFSKIYNDAGPSTGEGYSRGLLDGAEILARDKNSNITLWGGM